MTTDIGLRGWTEAADAVGLGEQLTGALGAARIVARGPKARGAIARLRETTGRDLIRTVVKRGYRLELMEAGTR